MSSSHCPTEYLAGGLEPPTMDVFPDDLLKSVFRLLPLFDTLRAKAVCKRWNGLLNNSDSLAHFRVEQGSTSSQSYCPLLFKRHNDFGAQHEWWGYDSTSSAWRQMGPLQRLPPVDIRPLAGNGKALIGYKITTVPSQVVVGNPVTNTWETLPNNTETWGEVGNVLLVQDHVDSTSFQIIAVRAQATEIFHSNSGEWTRLRGTPATGVRDETVSNIRDRHISATLCGGLLFCYGVLSDNRADTAILVSFDVRNERWTEDCIRIPASASSPASSKCFQTVECAGNLFAVIENPARSTIEIYGLGLRSRNFHERPMVEMPRDFYDLLDPKRRRQLKAAGHRHRMFFWRNLPNPRTLWIVEFDFLLRKWAVLPDFKPVLGHAPSDEPDDLPQIYVDTGSYEP